MIELVIFIIFINIIFETIQLLCPTSKLAGFVRSSLSILVIFLICLKIKNYL